MALPSIILKSSSSVVPLALRAISCAGSRCRSIAATTATTAIADPFNAPIIGSCRFASTAADDQKSTDKSLLKVLRSEIRTAKKSDLVNRDFPIAPSSFPFTIKHNFGERFITLTRESPNETIEIIVEQAEAQEPVKEADNGVDKDNKNENESDNSDHNTSKEDDSDSDDNTSEEDDSDNDEENKEALMHLPMSMSIRRVDGKSLKVEVFASLDEIKVDHMSLVESDAVGTEVEVIAPYFEELDEDLQHCLMKYLGSRGIQSDHVEFLHKYMAAKSQKDDLLWMKKLKQFIKN